METHEKLRIVAGILLIISAITHVSQIYFYGTDWHTIVAAVYGASYAILGGFLIYYRKNKLITLLCIFLPAIGGSLGMIRFFTVVILEGIYNFFIIFHVIVDIIVVPICIYSYFKIRKED
ncbi:MAG: hypothetical protein GF383_07085 [Candidatus Lokiarchaeota archaeon]|nr:hypothetical protein [Candidatus Lokiarchaeota archaeon]MBD3339925.1 hypothetical protein [Candidatus Lokiarchaeota archaeon]